MAKENRQRTAHWSRLTNGRRTALALITGVWLPRALNCALFSLQRTRAAARFRAAPSCTISVDIHAGVGLILEDGDAQCQGRGGRQINQ